MSRIHLCVQNYDLSPFERRRARDVKEAVSSNKSISHTLRQRMTPFDDVTKNKQTMADGRVKEVVVDLERWQNTRTEQLSKRVHSLIFMFSEMQRVTETLLTSQTTERRLRERCLNCRRPCSNPPPTLIHTDNRTCICWFTKLVRYEISVILIELLLSMSLALNWGMLTIEAAFRRRLEKRWDIQLNIAHCTVRQPIIWGAISFDINSHLVFSMTSTRRCVY